MVLAVGIERYIRKRRRESQAARFGEVYKGLKVGDGEPAEPSHKADYHKVWDVLWLSPSYGPDFWESKPCCPTHCLEMDYEERYDPDGEHAINFVCRGGQGGERHEIWGPRDDQLAGRDIHSDVEDQIEAKKRRVRSRSS